MLSYVDRRSADQQIKSGQGAAPVPKRQVGREMGHGRRSVVGLDSIAYLCVESPFRLCPVPYPYMVMGSSTLPGRPRSSSRPPSVVRRTIARCWTAARASAAPRTRRTRNRRSGCGGMRPHMGPVIGGADAASTRPGTRPPPFRWVDTYQGAGTPPLPPAFRARCRMPRNGSRQVVFGRLRRHRTPDWATPAAPRCLAPVPEPRCATAGRSAGRLPRACRACPQRHRPAVTLLSSSRHGPPLGDGDHLPQAVARAAWASARGTP